MELRSFLNSIAKFFRIWKQSAADELAAETSEQTITRLGCRCRIFKPLYCGNHFKPSRGVLAGAFEPPHSHPNELSVADGTGIDSSEKLRLCLDILALINKDKHSFRLKAWAEVDCADIEAIGEDLKIEGFFAERDNHPFERHTNIKGYPPASEDARRLAIMTRLVDVCWYQRVHEKNNHLVGELTKN